MTDEQMERLLDVLNGIEASLDAISAALQTHQELFEELTFLVDGREGIRSLRIMDIGE